MMVWGCVIGRGVVGVVRFGYVESLVVGFRYLL